MDKCREEFEKWFEETHDVIITTQFKKEGERYLDRNVRRSFESWQHQQAKVEELKASHHGEVIGHEVHFKKIKQERDELQTLYTQQTPT
ncbi:TPA: hypothetical protein JI040_00585 [Acinetobacter baumannii]|nr:hypothetical protein [Acinetobacter baumannii]